MMTVDQFGIEFDGLNDFLYVMNGVINNIGGMVLGST